MHHIYFLDLPRKVVRLSEDPIVHEDLDTIEINNDIALLKLVEEVDVKLYTPICLPSADADYNGRSGQVYGEIYPEVDEDDLPFPCRFLNTDYMSSNCISIRPGPIIVLLYQASMPLVMLYQFIVILTLFVLFKGPKIQNVTRFPQGCSGHSCSIG